LTLSIVVRTAGRLFYAHLCVSDFDLNDLCKLFMAPYPSINRATVPSMSTRAAKLCSASSFTSCRLGPVDDMSSSFQRCISSLRCSHAIVFGASGLLPYARLCVSVNGTYISVRLGRMGERFGYCALSDLHEDSQRSVQACLFLGFPVHTSQWSCFWRDPQSYVERWSTMRSGYCPH
jgi:hypothetical protein